MRESICIVLLSGGVDSATLLWKARKELDADIYAITFIYGQRHSREIESARKLAQLAGALEHRIVDISYISWAFRSSRLVQGGTPVQDLTRVSIDYVPQRNLVFLSIASAWLESLLLERGYRRGILAIAVHRYDPETGYPDTRPEFLDAVEKAINLGSAAVYEGRAQVSIWAPFAGRTKIDIVREGLALGVPYEHTWSCYRGEDRPCGECLSCTLRLRAFMEAGSPDPLTPMYRSLPDWYREWLERRPSRSEASIST